MMQRRKLVLLFLAGMLACPFVTGLAEPIQDYFTDLKHSLKADQGFAYKKPVFSKHPVEKLAPGNYAEVLGWMTPAKNVCGGFYQEPAIVVNYPNPTGVNQEQTTVTADLPSLFSQKGTSVLRGNVTVTQPGRQSVADIAYLNRDPKTGKIVTIDLVGNVYLREAGKLIVAQRAHLNLVDNTATVDNAVYRFANPSPEGILNAWGTLHHGHRESKSVLDLFHGSYSTCPPTTNTWRVRASHLHLDKEKGQGTAINSFLDIKNIPVFYLPYFNFPLDNRRKSGFLFPTFGFSTTSGFNFGLPYYFNLAPNYDATVTPTLITRRGVQQNLLFRYLTTTSSGALNISVLPDDELFEQFKKTAQVNFSNVPDVNAYLARLHRDSDTRGLFSYTDTSTFNEHWSSTLNLNYVTDDYYFQDFANTPASITADQLLNENDINYQGEHWRFLSRLQGYQTLHPINEGLISGQYSRLPELDLSGDYPNEAYNLDYQLESQFTYFDHIKDFITGQPVVTGDRYEIAPTISWPLANMSGYFTPQLQLNTTGYGLKNQTPGLSNSITRVLPIFDIDSGLFFDRNFSLFSKDYRQTFEPRIFYLYVPDENQNAIPLFDTVLPPFNFAQMFQTNRFTGIDRIGDANQVTLALTTRLLNDAGQEKLRASIGDMFLFQQHRVICNSIDCVPDPTINETISPLAGELSYDLNPQWTFTSDVAWDPSRSEMSNSDVSFIYSYDRRVLNFGYYFIHNGDIFSQTNPPNQPTSQNNLNRINVGFAWPLTQSWSALADWNYNISHKHPQVYYYGAEYSSCCWAMRLVASHTLIAEDQLGKAHFQTVYYAQFQLKGLGNFGYNNPGGLITSTLLGYQDDFGSGKSFYY